MRDYAKRNTSKKYFLIFGCFELILKEFLEWKNCYDFSRYIFRKTAEVQPKWSINNNATSQLSDSPSLPESAHANTTISKIITDRQMG